MGGTHGLDWPFRELLKNIKGKVWSWWSARQRRLQRTERLRNRTRDAVQEELRRREIDMTPRALTTRMSSSTTRMSPPFLPEGGKFRMRGQPATIPANRLEAYTGPFFITTHGDRVHMTSYCHGQRNATRTSRRYQRPQYRRSPKWICIVEIIAENLPT